MTSDAWSVVFATAALEDLTLIEQHLIDAYQSFGETAEESAGHAAARTQQILSNAERLATAPLRGDAHDDLLPGLRHLSLDRAIYWFVVDDLARQVRVLAMFFGGQEHQRQMLVRLLRRSPR